MGLLNIADSLAIDASEWLSTSGRGNVEKSPSSKAAAVLTRGAYSQYVSTAKGRERRWRLFSTLPKSITYSLEEGDILREIATIGGGSHVKAWREIICAR